jgi:hypothetical protein
MTIRTNDTTSLPSSEASPAGASINTLADGASKFAFPVATVLGTGALAAVGIVMRDKLLGFVGDAVEQGTSAAKNVRFDSLLGAVGLQRRRSAASIILPTIGGLTVGLIGGAALSYFFAPKVKELVAKAEPTLDTFRASAREKMNNVVSPAINSIRDSIGSDLSNQS